MNSVVEAVEFLELSGDQVVDPDAAVNAMESIGQLLQCASEEEKRALLEYCRSQAAKLAGARSEQDVRRKNFYQEFANNMGLIDA